MNELDATFQALEQKLLHSDFSKTPEQLNQLLDQALEEIAANGARVSRLEVNNWLLAKDPQARWDIKDFTARNLSADLVLTTYVAKQIKPVESSSSGTRRSSIWKRSKGQWKMTFHQATALAVG